MKGFLPLLAALALGIAAGLYYAWGVNPVSYTDTSPAALREDFRYDYLTLIASAYDVTGDLPRARARLALFAYADPAPVLSALAQQRLAQGWPEAEARALARLAADIQGETVATPGSVGPSPTPAGTPTPIRTLTPVPSPAPTRTPTSTPGAPFRLLDREQVCDDALGRSLLQVEVVDAAGALHARADRDHGQPAHAGRGRQRYESAGLNGTARRGIRNRGPCVCTPHYSSTHAMVDSSHWYFSPSPGYGLT